MRDLGDSATAPSHMPPAETMAHTWHSASTLLAATRRRKSAPDRQDYRDAAAAAAYSAASAMRSGDGSVPGDIGCESWVQRAACLTTDHSHAGKGRLDTSHLLHLMYNNAGPSAVVAASIGAVPSDIPEPEPDPPSSPLAGSFLFPSTPPRGPSAQPALTPRWPPIDAASSSTASSSSELRVACNDDAPNSGSAADRSGHDDAEAVAGSWSPLPLHRSSTTCDPRAPRGPTGPPGTALRPTARSLSRPTVSPLIVPGSSPRSPCAPPSPHPLATSPGGGSSSLGSPGLCALPFAPMSPPAPRAGARNPCGPASPLPAERSSAYTEHHRHHRQQQQRQGQWEAWEMRPPRGSAAGCWGPALLPPSPGGAGGRVLGERSWQQGCVEAMPTVWGEGGGHVPERAGGPERGQQQQGASAGGSQGHPRSDSLSAPEDAASSITGGAAQVRTRLLVAVPDAAIKACGSGADGPGHSPASDEGIVPAVPLSPAHPSPSYTPESAAPPSRAADLRLRPIWRPAWGVRSNTPEPPADSPLASGSLRPLTRLPSGRPSQRPGSNPATALQVPVPGSPRPQQQRTQVQVPEQERLWPTRIESCAMLPAQPTGTPRFLASIEEERSLGQTLPSLDPSGAVAFPSLPAALGDGTPLPVTSSLIQKLRIRGGAVPARPGTEGGKGPRRRRGPGEPDDGESSDEDNGIVSRLFRELHDLRKRAEGKAH